MQTKASTAQFFFVKAHIVASLAKTQRDMITAASTFEEKLAEWKSTVVPLFTEWANNYVPQGGSYGTKFNKQDLRDFAPPILTLACQDFRVQEINRIIGRINALAEDEHGRIRLRNDDPAFGYIGLDVNCS